MHDPTAGWCATKIEAGLTPMDTEVHVYPPYDLVVHMLTNDCGCGPVLDPDIDGVMFSHNAWDARE